jgi:hypothetical protein
MSLEGRKYFFGCRLLWAFLAVLDDIMQNLSLTETTATLQEWLRLYLDIGDILITESTDVYRLEKSARDEIQKLGYASEEATDFLEARWLQHTQNFARDLNVETTQDDQVLWQFYLGCNAVDLVVQGFDELMEQPEMMTTAYRERYRGVRSKLKEFEQVNQQLMGQTRTRTNLKDIESDATKNALWSSARLLASEWHEAVESSARESKLSF